MSFYDEHILPHLLNLACSTRQVMKLRRELVPRSRGNVLEIGMGSGLNLPYYDPRKVEKLWGLEPSAGMRKKASPRVAASAVEVEWLDLPGEEIPLPDNSVDTVLLTFTLCTIPDWHAALQQMHRVLKPEGKLLFCEHGRSSDANVCRWQNRVTPAWRKIAGGCHLNRPISDCLQSTNFSIEAIDRFYMKKTPRVVGCMYFGEAIKI